MTTIMTPTSPLAALKNLGTLLRAEDEQKRINNRIRQEQERDNQLQKIAAKAQKIVAKRLGSDVADSLGPWRWYSSQDVIAAIGEPDGTGVGDYYEGDAPGQDGEIRYYSVREELWYRPRMTNASARIESREHFARMIVRHSIYADF